jgi:hypothetical protein
VIISQIIIIIIIIIKDIGNVNLVYDFFEFKFDK